MIVAGLHPAVIVKGYMSDLEKEFKKVSEKINAKLAEAAKAINEAVALAADVGVKGFVVDEFSEDDLDEDEYEKLGELSSLVNDRPLIMAMSDAGWRMSSIGC